MVKKGDDDGQKEDGEHGRTHMQNVRGVPNEFPSILWRDMRPNSVTSRKYIFDVTSVGQRSSPWTCNPVKVEVKFHLECKLRSSCAQLMSVVTIDSRTLTGRHCFGSIYCLKEQHEWKTASSNARRRGSDFDRGLAPDRYPIGTRSIPDWHPTGTRLIPDRMSDGIAYGFPSTSSPGSFIPWHKRAWERG